MSRTDEAWNDVGEQFKKLGSMFRHYYETQETEPEPEGADEDEIADEDEVAEAMQTLGESVRTALGAASDAISDPALKDAARQTAGSFFSALGTTFSEIGAEITEREREGEAEEAPAEAAAPDEPPDAAP